MITRFFWLLLFVGVLFVLLSIPTILIVKLVSWSPNGIFVLSMITCVGSALFYPSHHPSSIRQATFMVLQIAFLAGAVIWRLAVAGNGAYHLMRETSRMWKVDYYPFFLYGPWPYIGSIVAVALLLTMMSSCDDD